MQGLASGTYYIDVYSGLPAEYGLGMESVNDKGKYEIKPFQPASYEVKKSVISGQKFLYDYTYAEEVSRTIEVSMTNIGETEATVRVELLGSTLPVREERIAAGDTIKCLLTFDSEIGKIYSVVISGISGVIRYSIESDPQIMRARVSQYAIERRLDNLTYFSAQTRTKIDTKSETAVLNEMKDCNDKKIPVSISYYTDSVYYDLETVPLDVTSSLIDLTGAYGKATVSNVISKWELVALEPVSKTETRDGNQVLYQQSNPINKIILFKGRDSKYRLMIDWLEEGDVNKRIKVGQIKGYGISQDNCLVSSDLYIRPLDPTINSLNKDWDQAVFNKIKEFRTGVKINTEYFQLAMPLQMIRGIIKQECSYSKKKYYRYEPFSDLNGYYYGNGGIANIKKDPELSKLLHLSEGDTIFKVVWSQVQKEGVEYKLSYTVSGESKPRYIGFTLNSESEGNVYPPALWNSDVRKIFDTILMSTVAIDLKDSEWQGKETSAEVIKEKKARVERAAKYLEICLNYGKKVANRYYTNEMKDFYDPTKFDDLWKQVGTSYVNHPDEAITLNPQAKEPYDYHPSEWPQDTTEEKELKERFLSLLKSKGVNVAKEYWETWLKYDSEQVNKWYKNNLQEDLHPKKVIGQTPFIAQRKISASYGPMQLMYESAFAMGYRADPLWDQPKNEQSLVNFQTCIPLSMNYYISVKMMYMLNKEYKNLVKIADPQNKKHYVFKFPLSEWSDIFSKSMVYYNGDKYFGNKRTYYYPVSVRTREANMLPDVKE